LVLWWEFIVDREDCWQMIVLTVNYAISSSSLILNLWWIIAVELCYMCVWLKGYRVHMSGGVFFEPSYSMTKLHSVAVTVWHYVRYIARCDGGEQG